MKKKKKKKKRKKRGETESQITNIKEKKRKT